MQKEFKTHAHILQTLPSPEEFDAVDAKESAQFVLCIQAGLQHAAVARAIEGLHDGHNSEEHAFHEAFASLTAARAAHGFRAGIATHPEVKKRTQIDICAFSFKKKTQKYQIQR